MYPPRLLPLVGLLAAVPPVWADPPAPAPSVREGEIVNFDCGDNCYLTIRTPDGAELTGLCHAPDPCDLWFAEQAMPVEYVGETVRVQVGTGTQFNAEGAPMGTMEAFTEIEFTREGFAPPGAEGFTEPPPEEILNFIPAGGATLAVESADLNGDGRADYLMVTENSPAKDAAASPEDSPRVLRILVRGEDGRLTEAARNDQVVYCRECGGVFGDPFAGVEVAPGTFTVHNYGGSGWRWGFDYRFDYSGPDRTWQLVQVTEISSHSNDPDSEETRVYSPPRDFGKIDLQGFDPENWKDQGPR